MRAREREETGAVRALTVSPENTTGPAVLAQACARRGVQLLTFSSDLVFDGAKPAAYLEGDQPRPLNVYGKSKQQAETGVLEHLPQALVVRTSAFFGAWDEYNFVYCALKAAHEGLPFEAANDLLISPTYVPDLVNTSLDLLIDEERGVWHLASEGAFTWAELAGLAVGIAGLDRAGVVARPARHFGWPAARPVYSVLGSREGQLMPTAESGLHRCVHDIMHQLRTRPLEAEAVAS